MLKRSVWRTSTFRLTMAFGAVFALAVVLLLGFVYEQTSVYLSRRVDRALGDEAAALRSAGPSAILRRVEAAHARDPVASFGLFTSEGERVAGDGWVEPADLVLDGRTRDLARRAHHPPQRARGERLGWGEILIVQRDISQLIELRLIVMRALLWSGVSVVGLGLAFGIGLSLQPLRRVQTMRAAADRVAAGDLTARFHASHAGGDELDELARIVNAMLAEVERLTTEARTVGEGVAHELRTPLTRLRAKLDHAARNLEPEDPRTALIHGCIAETDGVLARFRALLRIAAVEARNRRAGVAAVALAPIVEQIGELYAPLAVELGIDLQVETTSCRPIPADAELIFEALSNLVDNALKFTPQGGAVRLQLSNSGGAVAVTVSDNGAGIPATDRDLLTRRFYRSALHAADSPGHGLGLSLVAAVAALHGFELSISDAAPGAVVRLQIT